MPPISAPISNISTSEIPAHSGFAIQVKQSLAKQFIFSTQTSKASTVQYSPVYKNTGTHIEELNLRLKSLNKQTNINSSDNDVAGAQAVLPDINPSVGSDNEKESELNIQQLESSVSSLSGLRSGSSAVNSPETVRNRQIKIDKNWHVERYETDF